MVLGDSNVLDDADLAPLLENADLSGILEQQVRQKQLLQKKMWDM
jgi:hypothetical protein